MFKSSICLAFFAAAAAACTSGSGDPTSAGAASDLAARSSTSWLGVVDSCVQTAIGAAAVKAFDDSNLQHLYGIAVDGDLATEGLLTITVTTGNDEDGSADRVVKILQKIDATKGTSTCTVQQIDGKVPGDLSKSQAAFDNLVDPCFGKAVLAAQKISDNYWHLYGMKVDGDLAVTGKLAYTITQANDEDGDTNFAVAAALSIDPSNGKETCAVTSAKMLDRK